MRARKRACALPLALLVAALCAGFTGGGRQPRGDLEFTNDWYSYEAAAPLEADTWCPYGGAYLDRLREDYALEEKTAGCKDDFGRVQEITRWVTNLWAHDGDNVPAQDDPAFILRDVLQNGTQYRCVEYGKVIAGCLNALGIPARTIGLKTEDVETRMYGAGHVATEAYLRDSGKWVFIDGQWGAIPLAGDTPLNAVQFCALLRHPGRYGQALRLLSLGGQDMEEYRGWIREYLYYLDVTGYQLEEGGARAPRSRMLTPLGAKEPAIFQVFYPLEVDGYTHSVPDFYPPVK